MEENKSLQQLEADWRALCLKVEKTRTIYVIREGKISIKEVTLTPRVTINSLLQEERTYTPTSSLADKELAQ